MKNGHVQDHLDALEVATIGKLARRHGFVPTADVLSAFERLAQVVRDTVWSWHDIPAERRRELLSALGHAGAEAMRAFDHECKARDGA